MHELEQNLTLAEKQILIDTQDEYKRSKNFNRIFPNDNYEYYKLFFQEEKPLNKLIADMLMNVKAVEKPKPTIVSHLLTNCLS